MSTPSSNHQYQAIFRDTVLFGAADQSDPKWNTPVRVTVHVPKSLLPEDEGGNFASESLDQISEAPPPVVEMTKMHTNTYHSLYVNDGLVKEAVLNDDKGVSGKYKAISRDLGDNAKAYYNMVIDQALSAAGFDTNSLVSPTLLPTEKPPDTTDEAAQRAADNQLDRFVTNPLTGYIESFAGGQISYGVANHLIYTAVHFAQARETAPSLAKAAWSTFHASFLKPCYQGVQDMVNLARNAPHEISQGVQADRHKSAWIGYLARTAGKPQILIHELRGSGLNGDSRLHDLDPTRHRVATTLLQKGHFDGPLMEGDTGYGCEDSPMQQWLSHSNLQIDLSDLQEVQNQTRAHFHGQGVYSGYDWRFHPEHLGLATRTNDIGVTEPGWFGDPESLEPDFFIRDRQHDGHAAITDASDPVDIVCFPHPELDLAVRASLDSASLAAHYLETPEFRAKFLTDAANHIEAEAPEIADEIRAQREYNQRTLDLAHDHVYEGKLKGSELREAVIHSIALASGIDGQTTFEGSELSMAAKSSLNQFS